MSRLTSRRIEALPVNLDTFVDAYLTCALWASTDEEGRPLDSRFDTDNIPRKVKARVRRECADFLEFATDADNPHAVSPDVLRTHGAERAGHDFFLTRNGHGAGFWDRGLGADGDKLTKSSKVYGSADFYPYRGRVYCD